MSLRSLYKSNIVFPHSYIPYLHVASYIYSTIMDKHLLQRIWYKHFKLYIYTPTLMTNYQKLILSDFIHWYKIYASKCHFNKPLPCSYEYSLLWLVKILINSVHDYSFHLGFSPFTKHSLSGPTMHMYTWTYIYTVVYHVHTYSIHLSKHLKKFQSWTLRVMIVSS